MAGEYAAVQQAGQERLAQTDEATKQFFQSVTEGSQQLFDIIANTKATGSRVENGTTIYTTPLQVQTENIAKLEAQNRTQNIARELGVNPDGTADIQYQLAKQIQESAMAVLEQGKKVRDMQQVGLFDDPLQFMVNQVLLPDEVNKLNGHQNVLKNTEDAMTRITQATHNAAQTSNDIATKITQANLDDQISAAQAELDNKKRMLGAQANFETAKSIRELYSMQGDRFQTLTQLLHAANSQESLEMQREARAQARKMYELQVEKYQDEKDRIAYVTSIVQEGEKRRFGAVVSTPEDIKFNWGNGSARAKYHQDMFNVGSAAKAGLAPSVGDSILERVQSINNFGFRSDLDPSVRKVMALQSDAVAKAQEQFKGAKPETINEEAQKIFDKNFEDLKLKVDPKDQTHPFKLPGLATMDQSAELKSNPAYQYYRSINKDPNAPTDIDHMLHTMVPAMMDGKIKSDDVVKAITAADTVGRTTNTIMQDIQMYTGKNIDRIGVPVTYLSTSQKFARGVGVAGVYASGVAASTGIGVPAAVGLGTVTAGALAYGANPGTHIINPGDPVAVRNTIAQMVPRMYNSSGTRMQGDGFYPSKTFQPGIDIPNQPAASK